MPMYYGETPPPRDIQPLQPPHYITPTRQLEPTQGLAPSTQQIPTGLRTLLAQQYAQEREAQINQAYTQVGWTPEKVLAMTPQEAWITSTYLQEIRSGKSEAQAKEETMKAYRESPYIQQLQEEEWVKGTISGKIVRGWQYAEKQTRLPVSAIGEFSGGAIGVFESWVPLFKWDYPRQLATPTSAVISTIFGTEQQGYLTPSSEWKYLGKHPAFLVGGLTGTYLESLGLGYAASKAFQGLKKIVPQAIQQPLYEAKEAVRFSRPAKALYEAKLWTMEKIPFYKLYEPFSKQMAKGEVGGKLIERFGLSELEASTFEFEMMQMPRMSSVYIAQTGLGEGAKSSWSYLMKGSAGWLIKEATFTPLVSQAQVTRMGLQPYIQRVAIGTTGKSISKSLVGFGLSAIPSLQKPQRLMLDIWQPTLARKREALRPQTLLDFTPKQKERKGSLPQLFPASTTKQAQQPFTIQIPKEIQIPKQKLTFPTPSIPTPQIPKVTFPFPLMKLPSGGSGEQGGTKSLFGKWFRKTQDIKTPKQILATMFGEGKPRRKHK